MSFFYRYDGIDVGLNSHKVSRCRLEHNSLMIRNIYELKTKIYFGNGMKNRGRRWVAIRPAAHARACRLTWTETWTEFEKIFTVKVTC